MKFPYIIRLLLLLAVAHSISNAYVVADVFEHLKDPLTWRFPILALQSAYGITVLHLLYKYFQNAAIGDSEEDK